MALIKNFLKKGKKKEKGIFKYLVVCRVMHATLHLNSDTITQEGGWQHYLYRFPSKKRTQKRC